MPTELRRQVVQLTGLESNQRTRDPKSRRPCQQSTGHQEPPTGVEPAARCLQGSRSGHLSYRGGAGTRRGAGKRGRAVACLVRSEGFGPSRPRGHRHLRPARLPFRHERMRAPDPDRTGACAYEAPLFQLSYKGMAAGQRLRTRKVHGFRARRVCQLDDPTSDVRTGPRESNPTDRRGLSSPVCQLPSRPLGAPPGDRTPFRGLRVWCIARHARTLGAAPGNRTPLT